MAREDGRPSTGRQIAGAALLLAVDLLVVAWCLFGYGMTGWADSYDDGNAPDAPAFARQAAWLLAGGAAVTGGALLALRWRLTAAVQLAVLGSGAAAFALFAPLPPAR